MAYLSPTTYPSPTTYLGLELPGQQWTYGGDGVTLSYNSDQDATYGAEQDWTYTPVTG